jgi:hypothetical protein
VLSGTSESKDEIIKQ